MATRSNSTRRKTTGRKKSATSRKKSATSRKTATPSRKKAAAAKRRATSRTTSASGTRKKSTSTGRKKTSSRKYSPSVGETVRKEMHEFKRGTARSGRKGGKVKSRKQAIAIGLNEARQAGKKVPPNPNRRRKKSR
jgi:hypothetical protein